MMLFSKYPGDAGQLIERAESGKWGLPITAMTGWTRGSGDKILLPSPAQCRAAGYPDRYPALRDSHLLSAAWSGKMNEGGNFGIIVGKYLDAEIVAYFQSALWEKGEPYSIGTYGPYIVNGLPVWPNSYTVSLAALERYAQLLGWLMSWEKPC